MSIAAALATFSIQRARAHEAPSEKGHPRLYFRADDLPRLRKKRSDPLAAYIWRNFTRSADQLRDTPPRAQWIPTANDDPQYENLYDRFYAAMHDMATVEHLAFASVLSDPDDDPYFDAARSWSLAAARVWRNEASNAPDASKAYAVLRVMKALAVAYDALYPRLSDDERREIREALVDVCREYSVFFQNPATAGAGYNKHHGSVDAAPFGIVALALLGEVPEAEPWLELMIQKHTEYLFAHALTPSGTNDQSSNFWASTMQYRILFMDALRRVTGRDLFAEFPDALPGRIGLAAIAAGQSADLEFNEPNRSVLFGPSYGQIDYWSPVLVFLAREQRRPIYQYLASWDESLGSLQSTRYITPTRREQLLFSFGGYAYVWCDPTVPAEVEVDLPRAFEFPEPEVNEAYLRDSYRKGDIVVGIKKGGLVVHAGGLPVLVDQLPVADVNAPAATVDEMLVADDGRTATIRCVGPQSAGLGEQRLDLHRPGRLAIRRTARDPLTWWFAGDVQSTGQTLVWSNGVRLEVVRGRLSEVDRNGYEEKLVHYAGMKYADPHRAVFPTVTVEPVDGVIELFITRPAAMPTATN